MMQKMIVSARGSERHAMMDATEEGAIVVSTPLDAILRLERRNRIRTVVLTGSYARSPELAAFLWEFYPTIQIERMP
jgi:hypothetical protein